MAFTVTLAVARNCVDTVKAPLPGLAGYSPPLYWRPGLAREHQLEALMVQCGGKLVSASLNVQ